MGISTKQLIQSLNSSKSLILPKKLHSYFLETVSELLHEGFSLSQSLTFMRLLMKKHVHSIDYILTQLEQGMSFESSLQTLGYSNTIVAQLFYAQRQGRFVESLEDASKQIAQSHAYRQTLIKTLVYPIFLGVGLVGMLFAMRLFLLPQIASFISQEVYEKQFLIRILVGFFTYLPQLFSIFIAFVLIIYGAIDLYLLKQTQLIRFQLLTKIPGIRQWVRSYCTYKISKEIGHFFKGGYSIQQMVQVMIDYPIDPFLTEVSTLLHAEMLKGEDLAGILKGINIFTEELPIVIYQGELTSQTAQKCHLYSRKVYSDLMEDFQKKLTLVQPILFVIIAVLVMAMYLLMMLPMLTMDGL